MKGTQTNPFRHYFLLFSFFLFGSISLFSQSSRALLLEPVITVVVNDKESWSYSFGIAHRGLLLETYDHEKKSGYRTEHLELNHYTRYRFSETSAVALRFRYRNNELFNEERSNEYRIIQEFTYSGRDTFFNLWHRLRFEQKFYTGLTVFRGRYRIGISQPLPNEFSIGASTEALYSVSKKLKPEPEQRFMLSLENTSFEDLGLNLGVEYRLSDYHRDPVRETFIYTSATFFL